MRFMARGAIRRLACSLGLFLAPLTYSTGSAQVTADARRLRPLELTDLLGRRSFILGNAVALSPDGQSVAYALGFPKPRDRNTELVYDSTGGPAQVERSRLYVTDTSIGDSTVVSGGAGEQWAPVWSPDGQYLAFCSTRDGMARLWIWERATGALRLAADVTVLVPTTSHQPPRWLPDSRRVIVKVLPEELTVDGIASPTKGARGRADEGPRSGVSGATVSVYVSPGNSGGGSGRQPADTNAVQEYSGVWSDRGDLAVVDIRTGTVRRLTLGTHPMWYMPSPDGRLLAYAEHRGLRGGNNWRRVVDLKVVSLGGGSLQKVTPGLQQELGTISWSPNSRALAYTQFGRGVDGEVRIIHPFRRVRPVVSRGPHASFNSVAGVTRIPLWNPDGSAIYMLAADTVWRVTPSDGMVTPVAWMPAQEILEIVALDDGRYWSPDGGRSMYVKTRHTSSKEMGFARLDLQTGRVLRRVAEPKAYGAFGGAHLGEPAHQGSAFVYLAEDVGHPADIWLSDTTLVFRRRLTHLNPAFDTYRMGASQLLTWRNSDGTPVHGALLLPAGYQQGRRYPLVVKLCGGETCSNSVHQFGLSLPHDLVNMQLFATRGYGVLVPDAPQEPATPMADLAKAILPGVNKVIELGIADPDRLGLIGHSYGGYSAMALLVQTKRFAAAVSSAAPSNWFTLFGEMSSLGDAWGIGVTEDGQGLMRGTPWEKRDKYIENSPYFYLDRIDTPLLIMQGTIDEGVYPHNSDELFVGLRRLGKKAVYLKYAGEGHVLSRYQNQLDYLTRILGWFDIHLNSPRQREAKRQ